MKTPTHIVEQYFKEHPEAKDGVMKAFYAYHEEDYLNNPKVHYFPSLLKASKCHFCGRRREDVRWDDLPPQCQKRPLNAFPDIGETLDGEETRANALYEKAKLHVPRLVKKMGMSGGTLATLHHTHGYDPETVGGVVDVPPEMMTAYNASMETERDRSRKAIVREVISCVFDDPTP